MTTTTTPTVGLFGATGNVGSLVLTELLSSARAGKIRLVVLHRPGSKLADSVSSTSNVETRAIDADSAPLPDLVSAVAGIQTLVSTVGMPGFSAQNRLVEAVAASPDFVTFIPATYGFAITADMMAHFPTLVPVRNIIYSVLDNLKERGLGTTLIRGGFFANYLFGFAALGTSVKDNVVQANEQQMENPFPITTLEYLARGIAHVVTQAPESIKGKEYAVITLWASGKRIAEALKNIHGTEPTIKGYTEADAQALAAKPSPGPTWAGYADAWQEGVWGYEGEFTPPGASKPSLEEVIRLYI